MKYRWNTIIDDKTCLGCLVLDGEIFTPEQTKKLKPPLHKKDKEHATNCRCYLTEEN